MEKNNTIQEQKYICAAIDAAEATQDLMNWQETGELVALTKGEEIIGFLKAKVEELELDYGLMEIRARQFADQLKQAEDYIAKREAKVEELTNKLREVMNAGQEALDYSDGSGRPILQEAIWSAQEMLNP